MNDLHRRIITTVASVLVAVVAATAAGALWWQNRVVETRVEPSKVAEAAEDGDPLVLAIAVPWTADGYCTDQFKVQAVETRTEVRVGTVLSRQRPGAACDAVGTVDGTAWAEIRLAEPLAGRPVVRARDGVTLPVQRP